MGFNLEKMHISHCIEKHPVLGETLKYKVKYLNVLEYFILKYSPNDRFALAMLDNYKKVFLSENIEMYSYSSKDLKLVSKGVTGIKFKGFKLFTYRYSLLCDCFVLNAFNDQNRAKIILNEIKSIYKARYHFKLEQIFSILFKDEKLVDGINMVQYQIDCWKKNRENIDKRQNTVLTTATMSAGKSTLINALIGKTINRTMNDACTSKLHHIFDKAYEDNFNYELDHELNLDASHEILMNDNDLNKKDDVFVSTYFRTIGDRSNRLCIVDTPGVNSSLNGDHALIAKQGVLNHEYNKLIYVINAENAGTDDDLNYLRFIKENVDKDKIVFVLNKLDRFRIKEDSIQESIGHLKADLLKMGFDNPLICPVSSYAGVLAKKMIYKENKTEDEMDDYEYLRRKFNKEEYNLSKYYSLKIVNIASEIKDKYNTQYPEEINLLFNSGFLCLEHIIKGVEEA